MTSIDYDAWALRYDNTRGASPSVLRPLLEALGPPDSRSVLDVGGGTGNVTAELVRAGFEVALCDYSPGMARQASGKLGAASPVAVADAQALPFRDGAFDCLVCVKVLNHVPDWRAALRETRRVIRGGPAAFVSASRETIEANWVTRYVPSLLEQARYHREDETVHALRDAGFARVDVRCVRYADMADGSAQALKHFPEVFVEGKHIRNTSLFHQLSPGEVDSVLERIRRDHESGELARVIESYRSLTERYGDGALFVARP